jgi:hypothetical protein
MTVITPSGTPASIQSIANSIILAGACSLGFNIQQFPAANAGANFFTAIME